MLKQGIKTVNSEFTRTHPNVDYLENRHRSFIQKKYG